MVHRRKTESRSEKDKLCALGIVGLQEGKYKTIAEASRELGVSRTTMTRHLKGGKTMDESREEQQLLTTHEEKALAEWISQTTATGNPVPYPYIKEMAEEIRKTKSGNKEFCRPIGCTWTRSFLGT